MSTITTVTLQDLVAQGEIKWREARDSVDHTLQTSGIFHVDNFGPSEGDTKVFSEIDGELYAKAKPEGAQAKEGRIQQGFTKTMFFKTESLTRTITREMRERNKYLQMERVWKDVGSTVLNRRELNLAHRIGFGTATSYVDQDGNTIDLTTGDTKALFATDHTLKGSSTTYRNILAGNPQASRGAFEAMEKMIVENTYNQFGEKMQAKFDGVWFTDDPNTGNTIKEILQSTAKISAPNEGVPNVYQGKYRPVSSGLIPTDANGAPDTTKAKYWGFFSTMETPLYLSIENNLVVQSPASGQNTEDILTDDWVYKSYGSDGMVAVRGTGITLSKGNGDA